MNHTRTTKITKTTFSALKKSDDTSGGPYNVIETTGGYLVADYSNDIYWIVRKDGIGYDVEGFQNLETFNIWADLSNTYDRYRWIMRKVESNLDDSAILDWLIYYYTSVWESPIVEFLAEKDTDILAVNWYEILEYFKNRHAETIG